MLADEYNDSQKCSASTCNGSCNRQLKKVTVKDGAGLSQRPHEVKQCTKCLTVSSQLALLIAAARKCLLQYHKSRALRLCSPNHSNLRSAVIAI